MIIRETLQAARRSAVLISLLYLPRQTPYYPMANLKDTPLFKNEDHHQANSTSKNNSDLSLSQLEDEIEKMVTCYPFVKLGNYSPEQLRRLDKEQRLTALAWQCLQVNDKDKLKKAYQALMPEWSHLQFVKKKMNYQGQVIFTAYFQKHLEAMMDVLNSSSATVAEKTCCLNTLVHMRPSQKLKEHLKLIQMQPNEKIPMFLVFWVVIKIKNELPYIDSLKKIEEVLQHYKEESTFDAVRMVYTLALVPYFHRFYSKPIVKGIFLIFRHQLSRMTFGDILACLKKVYQLNSKYSRWLAQDLIALIQRTPSSQDPQVISLIFKLLSYCSVLLVPSQELLLYLVSSLSNFRTAIIRSGLTQELFVSRLFEESKLDLSLVVDANPKLIQSLQKHLESEFSRLQRLDEIILEELTCALRVLINYRKFLSKTMLGQSSSKIVRILSRQSKDQKVRYGCLECLLSLPFLFQEGLFSIAQQIQIKTKISQHLQSNCQTLIGTMLPVTNINEVINLAIKVQEYRLQLQKTPNLCSIRFKELNGYSMDLPTLTAFLSYLIGHKLEQKEELHNIMSQLEFIIFSFFNNKLMPFKPTLQVLLLATTSEYSNSNLFPKICKALFEIIDKYPEFQIAIEDLQFLRENLTMKKRGNLHLDKFIQKCISDGQRWEKHREDYLKKQKEFYQREKSKSAKKNQGREEYI